MKLIPAWELSMEKIEAYRHATEKQLIKTALSYGIGSSNYDESYIEIRDLQARDLNMQSWEAIANLMQTRPVGVDIWSDFINTTVSPNQMIAITKIIVLSLKPTAKYIKFNWLGNIETFGLEKIYAGIPTVGGLLNLLSDPLDRQVLERLADETLPPIMGQRAEGWLSEPILLKPNQNIKFELGYDRAGANQEPNYIVLDGLVAQPKGLG